MSLSHSCGLPYDSILLESALVIMWLDHSLFAFPVISPDNRKCSSSGNVVRVIVVFWILPPLSATSRIKDFDYLDLDACTGMTFYSHSFAGLAFVIPYVWRKANSLGFHDAFYVETLTSFWDWRDLWWPSILRSHRPMMESWDSKNVPEKKKQTH